MLEVLRKSPVALAPQVSINQLDVAVVDSTGAVSVAWVFGQGQWQGPIAITKPGFAPAGAPIAFNHQVSMNQLDDAVVDNTGEVSVAWVFGDNQWQGPHRRDETRFCTAWGLT
jgi:hypothetical protein